MAGHAFAVVRHALAMAGHAFAMARHARAMERHAGTRAHLLTQLGRVRALHASQGFRTQRRHLPMLPWMSSPFSWLCVGNRRRTTLLCPPPTSQRGAFRRRRPPITAARWASTSWSSFASSPPGTGSGRKECGRRNGPWRRQGRGMGLDLVARGAWHGEWGRKGAALRDGQLNC